MEFAGGCPGLEGKDPDEVVEQLKNGVKKAVENTDQTKREHQNGCQGRVYIGTASNTRNMNSRKETHYAYQ